MSRKSGTIDAMQLREKQEAEGLTLINRISRFTERLDERLPSFSGKPGTICAADEGELASLSAHARPGAKNLAHASLANTASLSNEERFTASYYSEPLTAYTVGWTDAEDLERLVNFIAPKVTVGRRFEFKAAINKEAFYSELDDERAIGSEFRRVEYKGVSVNAATQNRGLKYRMDLDAEVNPNEQVIVARLLQRLRRNQFRRACATLLALTAPNNTNVVFSNTGQVPAPQPDEILRTAIQATQLTGGVFPNRLLIDLKAWNLRKAGYAAQLTAGGIASYKATAAEVAADLMVEEIMIAKAIYTSVAGTQANLTGTKAYIWPSIVAAFYGQDNPDLDDPSSLKHFVTPSGDGEFRVFRQPQGPKFVDITVETYDYIYATATVGSAQLTPT